MYSFTWVFAVRTIGRHAIATMQNEVQSKWFFDRGSAQYYIWRKTFCPESHPGKYLLIFEILFILSVSVSSETP